MKPQLFTNVSIFDGTGSQCFPGEVLVTENLITAVSKEGSLLEKTSEMDVIDCEGRTLMPGLVEAHAHVTYSNMVHFKELGEIPVEEHTMLTLQNMKLMLDSGFTSLYSAGSSKPRLEVAVRNAVNSGTFPGPRLRACSPEITATGGLGDDRQLHMHHQGIEIVADGVEEMLKVSRMMVREGVDTIKLNISGDNFMRKDFGRALAITEEEVAAVAEVAHQRGIWLACHARADESVKLALKYDFRTIYHCDFIEGETFDLLEEKRDSIFLAPAIGIIYTTAYEGGDWGITEDMARNMDMFGMLEGAPGVYSQLKKRGLRILPGGDYGFAWNPMGTNARDLEHFVNLFGFTPAEALMAATKWGGELMDIPNLGLVQDGYLADLLLIDGNPAEDVKLLQDRDKIVMIMKDGIYHKFSGVSTADDGRPIEKPVVSVWERS